MSHILCFTISRKEPNDNLSVEKYRVIYSVNVPIQLNCSVNLICCSLNVWFYCVSNFIVFFLKDKHLLKVKSKLDVCFLFANILLKNITKSSIWEKILALCCSLRGSYKFASSQMLSRMRLFLPVINVYYLQ